MRRNRESVINISEAKLKRLLRWLAEEIKLPSQIHPGYKLNGVVDPTSSVWTREERAYAYTGSFDFLITLETDDGRECPFVAVDFHGPVHAQPDKGRKDAIKEAICKKAGITYIVFTPEDLTYSSPREAFPHATYEGHYKAIEVMSHLRRLRLEHRLRNGIDTPTQEIEAGVRRAVADSLEVITKINPFAGCFPEWLQGYQCAETRLRDSERKVVATGYGWCTADEPLAHLKASTRSLWDALLMAGYLRYPDCSQSGP